MEQRNQVLLKAVGNLLEKHETTKAIKVLDRISPQDAADIIEKLPENARTLVFENWDASRSAETLFEIEDEERQRLTNTLSAELLSDIFKEMSADDAVDILADLPQELISEIVSGMDIEDQNKLGKLLAYKEDTAGGIMNPEILTLRKDMKVHEALQKFHEFRPDEETSFYLFVVNLEHQLAGVVSLRDLVIAAPDEELRTVMNPDVHFAFVDDDREHVARTMSKYNLLILPVTDSDKRLLGVVTIDDALDVIQDEATEDMYKIAGTLEAEEHDVAGASLLKAVRTRLPWLFVALLGEAILVGWIVKQFDLLISQVVALTIFWPAITAMGGNTAVQSATIIIRSIATGDLDASDMRKRVYREARLGTIIGAICALILFSLAFFWDGFFLLGIVVGISIMIVIFFAIVLGASAPLFFQRIGVDPAVSSGPFLTMAMDASSLLIYFGIAAFIFERYLV